MINTSHACGDNGYAQHTAVSISLALACSIVNNTPVELQHTILPVSTVVVRTMPRKSQLQLIFITAMRSVGHSDKERRYEMAVHTVQVHRCTRLHSWLSAFALINIMGEMMSGFVPVNKVVMLADFNDPCYFGVIFVVMDPVRILKG